MARPKSVIARVPKNISLAADVVELMEKDLHSDVEGRIPMGKQSELIETLLRAYYKKRVRREAQLKRLPKVTACNDKGEPLEAA